MGTSQLRRRLVLGVVFLGIGSRFSKSLGLFGTRELKISHFTENYLPMGRYYLEESEITNTAQPNMTSICSTGDSLSSLGSKYRYWSVRLSITNPHRSPSPWPIQVMGDTIP
ncbi:hypothetical protein PCANC_12165 [Puccinia coronata f. sp. avenae]|uniref:Uncharacterized protein n=1 Tax=Puccinia coronata f. sp. avenae TaxID=200324 RepID=A0A2N5VGR9_9BASI|nr:hypothetical protein PCANC_12165 [Puccinia coronata f. sp. avenae]